MNGKQSTEYLIQKEEIVKQLRAENAHLHHQTNSLAQEILCLRESRNRLASIIMDEYPEDDDRYKYAKEVRK